MAMFARLKLAINASARCCCSARSPAFSGGGYVYAQNRAITDLGVLPGHTHSNANDINNAGQIVGVSYQTSASGGVTTSHAVLWGSNGTAVTNQGSPFATAVAINNNGQLLVDNTTIGGLVWENGNVLNLGGLDLSSIGASHPSRKGMDVRLLPGGGAINDHGVVTGRITQNNGNTQGVIYDTTTGVGTNIGRPTGFLSVWPTDINNAGHIAAIAVNTSSTSTAQRQAVFYDGTTWHELGNISGVSIIHETRGINDSDEIIAEELATGHSILWRPGVGPTDLGLITAMDINNRGEVVGRGSRAPLAGVFAALYRDGVVYNLDLNLLGQPQNRQPTGWQSLNVANAINDAGQIVGFGTYIDPVTRVRYTERAFLLAPLGSLQDIPYLPVNTPGVQDLNPVPVPRPRRIPNPPPNSPPNPPPDPPMFFPSAPSGNWYDPPIVDRYHIEMTGSSLFTDILDFPVGFNNLFTVEVQGIVLGQFGPGQSVHFADFASLLGSFLVNGEGVTDFGVSGISPLVDPDDPRGFPIKLRFNTSTASFIMVPIPIPEPGTAMVLGVVGASLLWRRRTAA